MSGRSKPRKALQGAPNLLLAMVVALIMLVLFLRMVVFVMGHSHHQF